jgi:hypothetical protein
MRWKNHAANFASVGPNRNAILNCGGKFNRDAPGRVSGLHGDRAAA